MAEQRQADTVMVDFDLPFGTAGLDFNQDPLQGVADALSQPDRLDPVLMDRMMVRCTDRLSRCSPPRPPWTSDYDIAAEAFEEVTPKIRCAAPFVVLDLPHRWSAWMRQMLIGRRRGGDGGHARPGVPAQRQEHRSTWSARPGPTTPRRAWC